jgi:hypothetical protein
MRMSMRAALRYAAALPDKGGASRKRDQEGIQASLP